MAQWANFIKSIQTQGLVYANTFCLGHTHTHISGLGSGCVWCIVVCSSLSRWTGLTCYRFRLHKTSLHVSLHSIPPCCDITDRQWIALLVPHSFFTRISPFLRSDLVLLDACVYLSPSRGKMAPLFCPVPWSAVVLAVPSMFFLGDWLVSCRS